MDKIKELIRACLNQETISFFKAPGRINVIGEHTDYNGGLVLPGAVDRYMYFGFSFDQTDEISLHALDLGESVTIALNHYDPVDQEWANYLIGNLNILAQNGAAFSGFTCAFCSDIPIGAGMSSSSALECSFLYGINEIFDLNMTQWDMVYNSHQSNHDFMGVNGGILDQFSCIFGKPNILLMMDCDTRHYKQIVADFEEYSLLLINTNVRHNHLNSGYNDRVAECQSALASIQDIYPNTTSLSCIKNKEALNEVNFESATIQNRAVYIIEENNRVEQFAEALEKGDYPKCGKLLYEGHDGLSRLYEVSCPELDFMVDLLAEDCHVLGSRMMGGGFGGCTINLIKTTSIDSVIDTVSEQYQTAFDIEPEFYKVQLSAGASGF